MRVYELAEELDVSSNDVIEVLNQEFNEDVDNHMNAVNESLIPEIKDHITGHSSELTRSGESTSSALDTFLEASAFGVGVMLLVSPSEDDEKRNELREQIKELGREFTEPIRNSITSVLGQLINFSDNLENRTSSDLLDTNQIRDLIQTTTESFAGRVVEKTMQGIEQSENLFTSNGKVKK